MGARNLNIFIAAGEASADSNAAAFVAELNRRRGDLNFFGIGGSALEREGVRLHVDAAQLSLVGISEWSRRWCDVLQSYQKVRALIEREPIDCAVLLDLPDINLRLAKRFKAQNIPVIYFTPPQIWAWRRWRVHTIRRLVDRVLVVLPFEKAFYDRYGVQAKFVGHPLIGKLTKRCVRRAQAEIETHPRIALLPGSRRSEVEHHLPIFADVAKRLLRRHPGVELQIPLASTLDSGWVRSLWCDSVAVCWRDSTEDVLSWADVALVASGTATLETALVGTPLCIVYKMSRTSSFMARRVFRYSGAFGLPNILAGKTIVREFLYSAAKAEPVASELARLIEDQSYREKMHSDLDTAVCSLDSGGTDVLVADEIESVLEDIGRDRA